MIRIRLDQDGSGKVYDAELRGPTVLPSGENCQIITKSNGTVGGQACVLVKFEVQLPDGRMMDAQYTFTAREFLSAAEAVRGAHPPPADLEKPRPEKPGTVIRGLHRQMGWQALRVEQCYLISVEGRSGFSIAFTEQEALAMGPKMVDMICDQAP